MKKHGINIGDTIEFMDGTKKIIGLFHRIEFSQSNPIYAWVRVFNNDGKPGKREQRVWNSSLETIKNLLKDNR